MVFYGPHRYGLECEYTLDLSRKPDPRFLDTQQGQVFSYESQVPSRTTVTNITMSGPLVDGRADFFTRNDTALDRPSDPIYLFTQP